MNNHFAYKASLLAVSTVPLAIVLSCIAYYLGLSFISTFNGVVVGSLCVILFMKEGGKLTRRFFMRAIPTILIVSVFLSIGLYYISGYLDQFGRR